VTLRRTGLTALMSTLSCLGFVLLSEAADTYKVDPVHSTVIFRIKHNNVNYFNGRFDALAGTLTIDDQNPVASALDFKVTADSIDTADPKRDAHVKGPDFLNAKQFPAITFKSKQVAKVSDGVYDVSGDLTLHGVTKPVTVKLEQTGVNPSSKMGSLAGFEATFIIKRSEFGMTKFTDMLSDEVKLIVNIEARRS
jgi:polyisoprenoid-binding protein YceI